VPFSFFFVFLLGKQKKNEETKIKLKAGNFKLTTNLQIALGLV